MQAKLLLAALIGTAAANAVPRADMSKCQADLAALTGMPTPGPELISAFATITSLDPCNFTPPPGASAAFKSFTDKQKSWIAAHTSELKALAADCPQATGNVPSSYNCKAGSSPTGTPSSSDGSSSGGNSSGGSSSGGNNNSGGDGKSAGSRSEIALGAVLGAGMLAVLAL